MLERKELAEKVWYTTTGDETLKTLESGKEGLSDDAVRQRRETFGPNQVREQKSVSAWVILFNQFRSPLIYVLFGALAVTLAIQSWSDAIVIGAVLLINSTVGFIQEYKAESAVQSLMKMVSAKTRVLRNGREKRVPNHSVVPGDIVLLEAGGVVPADMRLLESDGLQLNEAALTGESVPVSKEVATLVNGDHDLPPAEQKNMAFMGTAVTSGSGKGVVTAIGKETKIGEIAESVQEAEAGESPLQLRINRLARWIAVGILIIAVLSFGVGVLLGRDLFEMLLTAVALSVAAIPAGLPIVVTVALAIGVHRMAKREAVIRNLPAVDTLGSCSVIVSDKTGTLTENSMSVQQLFIDENRLSVEEDELNWSDDAALRYTLLNGLLCHGEALNVEEEEGDPMEVALVRAALDAGMERETLIQRYPLNKTIPFRTENRFMATVHGVSDQDEEAPVVFVKGAPEKILAMCTAQMNADGDEVELDEDQWRSAQETMADDGLRVLAMAMGRGGKAAEAVEQEEPSGFVFTGLQGLMDPPRDSAVKAVDLCHAAGIRVMMVTGDQAVTAARIGERVHLGERIQWRKEQAEPAFEEGGRLKALSGRDLKEMEEGAFSDAVKTINIFARVEPDEKLRIVEKLKDQDEVVAVTGDGVNDAPALKAAHLGAAMGSGTDVAKEAGDMVITDDNFASIYSAVELGRTAFRNVRMATFFLLSTGAAVVLIILIALGLGWALPLVPAQILWCNVVTNGIADVALAFEPGDRSLIERPPRPKSEGILSRILIERLVFVGIWLAAGTLAVFHWQWAGDSENLALARTAALTTLVLFQKVHVFNCRSESTSIFKKSLLANKMLFFGVLASLAIHIGAVYWPVTQELLSLRPLSLQIWLVAGCVALTAIIVNELHKKFRPERQAVGNAE
jgi:calcium-translocating P-type ATPase